MGFTAPDVYGHGRHWRTLIATPIWDSFGPAGAGFSAKVASSGAVKPMPTANPAQKKIAQVPCTGGLSSFPSPEGVRSSYMVRDLETGVPCSSKASFIVAFLGP